MSEFDDLQRTIGNVIQRISTGGVGQAVSESEAERLFIDAHGRHHYHPSPDSQMLVVQASLISHIVAAAKEPPNWQFIAGRGAYANGSVWFVPGQPEVKRLYALLLTNCAVATCVLGGDNLQSVQPYTNAAYNFFLQLENPKSDRWVGTLYAVWAYVDRQTGGQYSQQYAQKAISLLAPLLPPDSELLAFVRGLAGQGNGLIVTPGRFGTKWGQRSRSAFFSLQDLYLLNYP